MFLFLFYCTTTTLVSVHAQQYLGNGVAPSGTPPPQVGSSSGASPSCLDESGKTVDWFVILKSPHLSGNSNQQAASGAGYAYLDSNTVRNGLVYTQHQLDQNFDVSLGATLSVIYSTTGNQYGWFLYNDQPPGTSASPSGYGHLKGVMVYDQNAGFWLVHSTPRFPNAPSRNNTYGYPGPQHTYGQSFLCINFDTQTLNMIASGLLVDKPYIFDSNNPFQGSFPNIDSLLSGGSNFRTKTAIAGSLQTTSVKGTTFTVFYKNTKWNSDLYENLVQTTLKTGMMWETWMNGPTSNMMPSFCNSSSYAYNSLNIRSVNISGITWLETQDHSKYGLSLSGSSAPNIVCIGDINRQFSQATRGGGTVCQTNPDLWTAFFDIVSTVDTC